MKATIRKVEFIKSSPGYKDCPEKELPEYAIVGRSNVGKSTLINILTGHKRLARTSNQPGQTRLINHFLINESWYLVDLPGYGYARVSKSERNRFIKIIRDYLLNRSFLTCLILLLDSRHKPQNIDMEFIRWLGKNEIPFALCFTKTDKISARLQKQNFSIYKDALLNEWETLPPFFFTSMHQDQGREDLLTFIEKTNDQITTGSAIP